MQALDLLALGGLLLDVRPVPAVVVEGAATQRGQFDHGVAGEAARRGVVLAVGREPRGVLRLLQPRRVELQLGAGCGLAGRRHAAAATGLVQGIRLQERRG